MVRLPQSGFSKAEAQALAKKYGFKAGYPLHARLKEVAGFRATGWPTPPARKKLETLEKQAAELSASLTTLEANDLFALGPHRNAFTDLTALLTLLKSANLSALAAELLHLQDAARSALGRQLPPSPGRNVNANMRLILHMLRAIYLEGTGRRDIVTRDSITDQYRGRYFQFLSECLSHLNVTLTEARIAALARWSAKNILVA